MSKCSSFAILNKKYLCEANEGIKFMAFWFSKRTNKSEMFRLNFYRQKHVLSDKVVSERIELFGYKAVLVDL